jgi:hypothetical protein
MEKTTHIKTSKKSYYGAIILSILFILHQNFTNNEPFSVTASGTLGIIAIAVVLYSFYKIFFGKGKIILSQSEFKIHGYKWVNWDDLASIYPFVEQDSENDERHFIHFRLMDGTDFSVRSEYLEMSFEQIAELISQYRTNYNNTKK